MTNKKYHIKQTGNVLIFTTANFVPGRGSVLHSGIYNRELASALCSFAMAGLAYTALVMNYKKGLFSYAASMIVFGGCFFLLRSFVFRERSLEAVFDISARKAEIFFAGMRRRRKESIPLKDIERVLIETEKSGVENPDGVEFVEKISRQHGVSLPGFGEEKIEYLLKLKLADRRDILIYVDGDMHDVIAAHDEITKFLRKNAE